MSINAPAASPANDSFQEPLETALRLLEQALGLIDEHELASDAGAHLDLAIHRLRESQGKPASDF